MVVTAGCQLWLSMVIVIGGCNRWLIVMAPDGGHRIGNSLWWTMVVVAGHWRLSLMECDGGRLALPTHTFKLLSFLPTFVKHQFRKF